MRLMTLTIAIAILAATLGCQGKPEAPNPPAATGPATKPAPVPAKAPDITNLKPGLDAELFNGKDLTGWNVLSKEYFDAAGKIFIRDGSMVIGVGSDLTGVQWAGEMVKNDYVISLEARRTEGSDFFCGLTFPINDSYVSLILGGWGGGCVGLSNVDDMAANENDTSQYIEFKDKKWYAVEVRVTGGRIGVFLDDKQIIDQEIKDHRFTIWPQQEPVRPLGVATYGTEGEIRRLAVRRVATVKTNP
ncbi:MAG: DUF1080 domain-containing protein [Phycisphaerae bacterium]|nr:DUF1080 domain-containing protein [Phycisphaerae bacterium]MDP7287823.1 DUF1080 domain-containing protein [Phycisphaerae bacterium]